MPETPKPTRHPPKGYRSSDLLMPAQTGTKLTSCFVEAGFAPACDKRTIAQRREAGDADVDTDSRTVRHRLLDIALREDGYVPFSRPQ